MPSYSESLIPSARAAKDSSSLGTNAQNALVVLAVRAIAAACGTGTYTAVWSITGATSENTQYLLEVLRTSGFTVSITTTNMTAVWS